MGVIAICVLFIVWAIVKEQREKTSDRRLFRSVFDKIKEGNQIANIEKENKFEAKYHFRSNSILTAKTVELKRVRAKIQITVETGVINGPRETSFSLPNRDAICYEISRIESALKQKVKSSNS